MKKLLTFITLTLALICLLASCGGQKDEHTHDFGEWKVTKAPTCTEEGAEVRYCDCGEKQTEVIVTLGHTFADWVTVKEPTVTEEGLKERTCACGEKDTVIVEKLIASEGLEYELNEDGQGYTVTGIGTCTDTDIVIPATYKDLPVTSIGYTAFYSCTGLTSVEIPDSVTSIGNQTFMNCTGLTSIMIPDSVTSIGNLAFSGCSSLTSIVIGDSVTSIGNLAFVGCTGLTSIPVDEDNTSYQSIDGNLYSKDGKTLIQYAIGKKNTSFTIPDSITSIGNWAFSGCTSLTSIVIPDSVTSIDWYAFLECTGLTSIVIPNSVTSIGNYAFDGCYKLVEVINKSSLNIVAGSSDNSNIAYYAKEVHNGESKIVNKNDYLFYTYDGVNYLLGYVGDDTEITLPENYNGESYEIYQYAFYKCTGLTSVVIPDSVETIEKYAFAYCSNLSEITLGESLRAIGYHAFYNCTGLTSIVIPDSVTSIGDGAFDGCKSLNDVYYTGTEAEWANISIGYFNSYLENATIHYNYVPEN